MSHIFLHIGHGKTGTSFLQSVLAKNVENLKKFGIDYDNSVNSTTDAMAGITTSGNIAYYMTKLKHDPDYFSGKNSLLFSSEMFWPKFADAEFVESLTGLAKSTGKKIKILAFIRDPLEHTISGYMQRVQQGGNLKDLEYFCENAAVQDQIALFDSVKGVITLCKENEFDLSLHNYSNCKRDLLDIFAGFLGLPAGDHFDVPARIVNRSVSQFEAGVQRGLARALTILSDGKHVRKNHLKPLVDATSDLRFPKPAVGLETIEVFNAKIATEFEEINAYLTPEQKYSLTTQAAEKDQGLYDEQYGFLLGQTVAASTIDSVLENLDDLGKQKVLTLLTSNQKPSLKYLRMYEKVLERLDPSSTDMLNVLTQLLEIDPSANSFLGLAKYFGRKKEIDEAVKYAELGFDIEPSNESIVQNLVNSLLIAKKIKRCDRVLKIASKNGVKPSILHFLEARVAKARGNHGVALEKATAALTLDPDNLRVQRFIAVYQDKA